MSSPDYSQIQGMHSELARLAQRVTTLERQGSYGAPQLPKSQIFSPKFFTRAFAIWGHVLAASFLFTIIMYAVMFLLMLILGVAVGDWF